MACKNQVVKKNSSWVWIRVNKHPFFLSSPLNLFYNGGLTFLGHADLEALLQPAVLTAVACDFVNLTVLVSMASVHHVFLDTATEETLKHQEARNKRG